LFGLGRFTFAHFSGFASVPNFGTAQNQERTSRAKALTVVVRGMLPGNTGGVESIYLIGKIF
jgi:hypothetical protein